MTPKGILSGRHRVMRSSSQKPCILTAQLTLTDSAPIILVPGGGTWNAGESVGLDLALLAAMPGMMGFSGDFAGLTAEQRARVAEVIAFFKQWRRFITGAIGHLMTPPLPISCREGWIAFQLQSPAGNGSLVFVYRLGRAGALSGLHLQGLDPKLRYTIRWGTGKEASSVQMDGATLMREGLSLHEYWNNQAAVCSVQADGA